VGPKLMYLELTGSADERGSSFQLPGHWLPTAFPVRDGRMTTLPPGHIWGNHFHWTGHEILIIMFEDRWSLHWDTGKDTDAEHQHFEGQGTVIVRVDPLASHAVRNDGAALLHVVDLSDDAYDPETPDTFPRTVTTD
jgi:hypothetical protein